MFITLNLVPTPKKVTMIDESYHSMGILSISCQNALWMPNSEAFKEVFENIFSVKIISVYDNAVIKLCEDSSLKPGAYRIKSDADVSIYASDSEGILYGLSSLIQLVSDRKGEIMIQRFEIEDYPDKDYRAFMVDLGRLWHPFDKLLKFVDICFLYKIKYLHLHFIDTSVYSLPSKVLPKLPTEGEHYSFDQIAFLNEYAQKRGIVLIPEYECPGHAPQFTAKYPEIFEDTLKEGTAGEYYTELGHKIDHKNIICAGSEAAWDATKKLLKEICDMFPDSPYINIGGDEAKIQAWSDCEVCRHYMKEHGLADERELYSEYIARVTSYVLTLGKTPIVWEGFPQDGSERIPKETIVIAWESYYNMPETLLESGFRVINASWQPLYIVPKVNLRWDTFDILKWDVYNWQHWWTKSDAFLNPIHLAPTDDVLGGMLCSWEQTYDQEIQFVIENLSAMSEKVWNTKRVCTDQEFVTKQANLIYMAALLIRDK